MKHQHCLRIVTLAAAAFAGSLSAQTNTFPASGNVGIGTLSPPLPLEVDGPGYLQSQFVATASGSAGGIALKGFNGSSFQQFEFQSVPSNATPASSLIIYDRTHGIYDLTINPGGNVGIGTTNPGATLDVLSNSPSSNANLMLTSGQDRTPRILFNGPWSVANSGQSYASIMAVNDNGGPGNSAASLHFLTSSGDPAVLTDKMIITGTGNVGIGTTTPSALLEVRQDTSSQTIGGRVAINNFASVSYAAVAVDMSDTNIGSSDPQTRIEAVDNADWSANLIFLTKVPGANTNSLAERMRISSSGNVGIGTTAPSYPLSVNGTIEAKEVIVQTGWSDYVFNPAYRLAPLSKVEAQIKEEGHLPGIPSAKEVAAHGVSLGDMEAKLLAKVEELTLRQIDEEKRIAALEHENDALQQENSRLEEMISKP